jgi:hypothetical protein
MTRRIGRYKKNFRRAGRDLLGSASMNLASPQLCPPRPAAERKNAREAADAIWAKVRRRPTSDEVNHGSNMAYWKTYPEGPHKIPSADHECAKRWTKIRHHFNERIQELMSRSSIKSAPKKRPSRGRRRGR